MRPIVTDRVAWFVGLSVGLSVVNPTKSTEPIEMPFGLWDRVGSKSHVLDIGSRSPLEGAILGKGRPL